MRIVLGHLRPHWPALAATFVAATLARLFLLADPQILRLIIDRYVMKLGTMPRAEFFRGVLILTAAAVVVGLLARTFRTFQEYWITLTARRVGASLYAKSIAHSLLLPYREFETQRSGELLHNIQRARVDAETGISGAVRLYLGALAIIFITVYAFTVHPLLGIIHAIAIPIVGIAMLTISAPIRRRQRVIAQQTGALAGTATETIRNVELVKSLGVESQEIDRLYDVNDRILELEAAKLRLIRRSTMVEGVLFHAMRATILITMLWLVFQHGITTGQFLTLFLYSSAIFAPLAEGGEAVARYQEARATFDTLDDLLDLPREERPADAVRLGAIRSVRFDDVSLTYGVAAEPALRDIDVELRAGDTVAFAGPSAAGKSSIVKLLLGLYTPSSGAVIINGVDLRRADLDAFRARIGLVTQETQLFAGTIRENLLIARPDATERECLDALDHAAAMPILARHADGLDTRIGEGGVRLSGGERQRVAIARALLRRPDILLFDEATSNLDTLTEREITETIRRLSDGTRITVLVAHRLSTLAHADRIHVLSRGAIVERGTHDALLAQDGLYASLWREQSRVRARTAPS